MGVACKVGSSVLGIFMLSLACQKQAPKAPVTGSRCSQHALQWVRQISSSANVSVTRIAATGDGGLVAIGAFKQSLRVAGGSERPFEIGARGDTDAFVLRLLANGNVAWHRRIGGLKSIVGLEGLLVRADGSLVVGGQYMGAPLMDSTPGHPEFALPSTGSSGSDTPSRLLLVIYEPDGVLRRAVTSADMGKERRIHSLASIGNDLAVSGTFSDKLWLGDAANPTKLESRGLTDVFLARLSDNGEVRWASRMGGPGLDAAGPLVTSRDGSLLIAGTFADRGNPQSTPVSPGATFGDDPTLILRSQGRYDAFIARISVDGHFSFAQAIGGPSDEPQEPDTIAAIVATQDNGALILANASLPVKVGQGGHFLESAEFDYGSLLAKFSADGLLSWALPLGPPTMSDMTMAPGGDLFVLGKVDERVYYPATGSRKQTFTPEGLDDILLARHGPQGELRWLMRFGGEGSDIGANISVDHAGFVTFSSVFRDDFVIDACPPVRLRSQARTSVLLARIAPDAVLNDQLRERQIAKTEAQVNLLRAAAEKGRQSKQFENACDKLREIVELTPKDPSARLDRASCLAQLSRNDEAVSEYHQAIERAFSQCGRCLGVRREASTGSLSAPLCPNA